MKQYLLFFITVLAFQMNALAQPFVCDGSFYLSLSSGGNSTVYQVTIDNNTGNVIFNPLLNQSSANINAIGYRITDNFIYGVHPNTRNLYRINATGVATLLNTLNISSNYSYVAGDVTPDGDTLILLGAGGNPTSDQILYKVDLTNPTAIPSSVNLTTQSTGNTPNFRSADIAIDPTSGVIYGFNGSKLVIYNSQTGVVDDVTFPNSGTADILGATFFDAFGNLKAYGRAVGSNTQQTFFDVNKNTGAITAVTTGPGASGNDGCSCPYTIKIQKTVNQDTIEQCGKVIFDLKIVNSSGIDRNGIDLQDVMPPDFTVTQIISNPFGGTVTGINTNTLNITDMLVPIGENTLQVEAKVSNNAIGTYFNQAILFDLPAALGGTAVSDYPVTVQVDDPTPIVVVPHTMQVEALGDTSICFGASFAQLNVQVTSGTNAPYFYSWSPNQELSSPNIQNPISTTDGTQTYTVTVTDAEGCTTTDDVTVTVDTLDIWLGNDTTICINDSVLLSAAYPALDGIQVLWNDGSTDTTYLAPGTGTYWVQATDACGNVDSDTINITESYTNVLTDISFTPVSCYGGDDGSATVVATQGTGPFTYFWKDSSTNNMNSNIEAGIWKVTVIDANDCRNVNQITVTQPPDIITSTALVDSASCFGSADGSALVTASGGVGGFTYAWGTIPIQNTTIATGLFGPSTYTVEVTDTNQCIKVDTISIPSPPVLSVSASSAGTICFGQADATAVASPTGGTPSYTFQWDANANNQTGSHANNLNSGIYFVTVTDYNGCTANTALTVGDAAPLDFEFETTRPTCFGDANGVLYVSINNGLSPYQYQWFDNSTLDSIPNLASGWYEVTATDGNGCVESDSVFLDQPDMLNVQVNTTDLSCYQSKDGQIYMIPIGGTPLYEYSIDAENFSNANIIYGLEAGSYPIMIRDSFDCEANTFVTLFEPAELFVNAGEDVIIEQGDSIQLEAIASTDSSHLTYIWTEQFIRNSLSCDTCLMPFAKPLADLFYTITVVDSNGCVAEDGIWVRVNTNRTVYVPNGFTPNGDLINDVFMIHGKEGSQILQLRVYDRWGEKVFEQSNFPVNEPAFGWDGTFKGEDMNTSVFGWTIEVLFPDGETRQFSGNVTLIR